MSEHEYSQGITTSGTVILKYGQMMTVEKIISELTTAQSEIEALRGMVAELESGLLEIERFGHGDGHGRGYTCANMAQRLRNQANELEAGGRP